MKKIGLLILLPLIGFSLHAGGQGEEKDGSEPLSVFVSIPPQKYFVEKIGGDLVSVTGLIGQNDDPHTFQPRPSQVTALGRADIYFTVGISFEEAFIDTLKKALPDLRIVDGSRGVALLEMEEEHPGHDEEHEGHHYDPHFWMGPAQVLQSAEVIFQELLAALPSHEEELRRNYQNFRSQINVLDAELTALLAPHRGEVFFVYHPSFGYFAHAYGLRQISVETGGKEPSPRQLESIIEGARNRGVKIIYVQPQFSQSTGKVIAEAIGGSVVPISPLAYDWAGNMEAIAIAMGGGIR